MTYEPGQAELQKACPLTFSESQKLDLLVAPHSSMHKNQNLYIYIYSTFALFQSLGNPTWLLMSSLPRAFAPFMPKNVCLWGQAAGRRVSCLQRVEETSMSILLKRANLWKAQK